METLAYISLGIIAVPVIGVAWLWIAAGRRSIPRHPDGAMMVEREPRERRPSPT